MNNILSIIAIILSSIAIIISLYGDNGSVQKDFGEKKQMYIQDNYIKEFYNKEVATLQSAHGLRKKIERNENDFILVDVRTKEEYEEEHILGAINIPIYEDRENTKHLEEELLLEKFKKLEKENPKKDIIIYCYSHYCMSGKKIGQFLTENNVFVRELTVGWNEWRYFWELWNYPHEKNEIENYIEGTKVKSHKGLNSNHQIILPSSINNTFKQGDKFDGCDYGGRFDC